ncbi:MAG: hypothetical protein HRU09_14875 [Oligoflexales bacterium]|nr:hypothetical protein [Oligoflexales bacterium]
MVLKTGSTIVNIRFTDLHLMLSNLLEKNTPKKFKKIHEDYHRALSKLEKSGKIEAILNKYDK